MQLVRGRTITPILATYSGDCRSDSDDPNISVVYTEKNVNGNSDYVAPRVA